MDGIAVTGPSCQVDFLNFKLHICVSLRVVVCVCVCVVSTSA